MLSHFVETRSLVRLHRGYTFYQVKFPDLVGISVTKSNNEMTLTLVASFDAQSMPVLVLTSWTTSIDGTARPAGPELLMSLPRYSHQL